MPTQVTRDLHDNQAVSVLLLTVNQRINKFVGTRPAFRTLVSPLWFSAVLSV